METTIIKKRWKKSFYHPDDILPKSEYITVNIWYEYHPDEEDDIDKHRVWIRIESGVNRMVLRNDETKEHALEIMKDIIAYLNKDVYLNEYEFHRYINTEDALSYIDR